MAEAPFQRTFSEIIEHAQAIHDEIGRDMHHVGWDGKACAIQLRRTLELLQQLAEQASLSLHVPAEKDKP